MAEIKYFFDSYALIEIFIGNENYEVYKKSKIVTSYFNLYEAYYNLRKFKPEEEIEDYFNRIKLFCINLSFDWIKSATDFKLKHKKENISYVDCLGYTIAKELGIKFLTGDKEFKDLDNVEFVK